MNINESKILNPFKEAVQKVQAIIDELKTETETETETEEEVEREADIIMVRSILEKLLNGSIKPKEAVTKAEDILGKSSEPEEGHIM